MSRRAPLVVILLIAFFLRVHMLGEIPPGLTHDEANHGREAIGILAGNLALFFPLNYGSEPLYSYTVAGLMALVGRGVLALRLVTVYFGLLALSATYLFGRLAFGRRVGWLAAALMAISFWPVASGREALRAGMMPFFSAGAMVFFWLLFTRARARAGADGQGRLNGRDWPLVAGLALCVTAMLYNYLAARVLWLVFPLFLLYLTIAHRALLRRLWPAVVGALGLSALLVTPMFVYLQQHPEAQTRLQMFGGVLGDLLQGNVAPLLEKAGGALLAFGWPGAGDQFLAYNIPGRPVLTAPTALFFVLGVAICLWRWRKPRFVLLLLWFLVGVTPSLLTGATANTTRNVGAMPATFLLPALGFMVVARRLASERNLFRRIAPIVAAAWLALVVWSTVADYFVRWGQAPEVRAAYMHTLVEQLAYAEANAQSEGVIVSSVLPGPAHNQSIGVVLAPERRDLRWVDARSALVLPPSSPATLLAPASTPLHGQFQAWVEAQETIRLRTDDLNPSFTVFELKAPESLPRREPPVAFGQSEPAVSLLGSRWLTPEVQAGERAELLQVWRVENAAAVGPQITAIDGSDMVLFTHILDETGQIVAQDDRLDAPSASWQTGDVVLQIHRITVPAEMVPGTYTAVAGLYDRASQQALPVLGEEGRWDATRATVDSLNIIP